MDPAHDHSNIQIRFHYDEYMCQKLQRYIWLTEDFVNEGKEAKVTYCLGWYRDP